MPQPVKGVPCYNVGVLGVKLQLILPVADGAAGRIKFTNMVFLAEYHPSAATLLKLQLHQH